MTEYAVEATHTEETCLTALDEIMAKDPKLLDKFVFGCRTGVHKGWAFIEAKSKDDILATLPKSMQNDTRVVEVGKFTPDQIKSFHKK